MSCGDFHQLLQLKECFDISSTRFYAAELVCGIQFLHQNDVNHRDLNPEYILVAVLGHLKITDFSLAIENMLEDCTATEYAGTKGFVAPEVDLSKVKILGIEESDKLTILRGRPDFPGSPGQNGEPGLPGLKAAKNCQDLLNQGDVLNGWYTIYPAGQRLNVLCDQQTDGGGWIVFQKRCNGSVDFFRDWNSYKTGFGNYLSEFWLGNENLHMLTSSGEWEMRIDLQATDNINHYAKYSSFNILGEDEKYKLLLGDFKEGNAGNSMDTHVGMPFSTKDKDSTADKCVFRYNVGWWYNQCHSANLNRSYIRWAHKSDANGIKWVTGKGYVYSYKATEMKMRPVQ
ncbi:ficolin-2-like [Leptodactylus fuscus]